MNLARRIDAVEETTVIFRQPDDEVPRAREPEPESIVGKIYAVSNQNLLMKLV